MTMPIKESITLNGKEISLETGRLAKQANGSVLVAYGDTEVLVTVTLQEAREDIGYFPLRVDYEERFYASGKIPGGFFKREGRPSDVAVLSARMIDRPIRPLFPNGYQEEVQIVATVLSVEPDCSPSILATLGASTALMISEAPFAGPIAGVHIGRVDGRLVVNPDMESLETGGVEITVAGTRETVTMVEGAMEELPEADVVEAIDLAHRTIRDLIDLQQRLVDRVQPTKKEFEPVVEDVAMRERVGAVVRSEFPALHTLPGKKARSDFIQTLRERAIEAVVPAGLAEDETATQEKGACEAFDAELKSYMRQQVLERGMRIDGRRPDEIRPIVCEVGVLPRTHGSSLFSRGETQSLGIVTLGATRSDEQIIDQMLKEGRKRFMLHYNFPPYSVGEVRRIGSPSRRSIGHGHLAEGAVRAVLPGEEDFPYSIRIVSEILESNGSSSMATVCSASLAMMDAGIPIRKPVAGIAMGMIEDRQTRQHVILTDILGTEDYLGDMDFKVAGTRDGVTAFQLDVKVGGVDRETMREALEQARRARLAILDEMTRSLPAPRENLSPYAPVLRTISIPVEKIGLVIGPGGKTIRQIIEETGASIDIEDDGQVKLAAPDAESVAAAERWILDMTEELEVGTVMKTKVTRVVDFGAFVELKSGSEGLVHVSNLASGFVDNVRDIVKPGDEITIEVIGEDKMGRPDLRRLEEGETPGEHPPRKGRRESGRRGSGGRDRQAPKPASTIKEGDIIEGTVANITNYGAFVELSPNVTGLIHISALSDDYVKRVEDVVRTGDRVTVEVLNIDDRGRYKLQRVIPESERRTPAPVESGTFDEAEDKQPEPESKPLEERRRAPAPVESEAVDEVEEDKQPEPESEPLEERW